MPEIYLYAELLIHIRQLTLHASVQNAKNDGSELVVSSDKTLVTAVHGDESASIYLPTQISGTATITFPLDLGTEFSTRLQVDDQQHFNDIWESTTVIDVPWSAVNMRATSSLFCKSCKCVFVRPGRIRTWKDLPSESWAELMDFWFCHKPHDEGADHAHAAEAKGFGASSKFVAAPTTGLVDVVSFLLREDDCLQLDIHPLKPGYNVSDLHCGQCAICVGSANPVEGDVRISKSRLSVQHAPDLAVESFPTATFICAQLLSFIENSVSRRVVMYSKDNAASEGLLCWIFNPDIYYTSSKKDATAHRAMKIFYKAVREPLKLLDENSNSLEELLLTAEDLSELSRALETSTNLLPQKAREFQEWKVGLLDRYEKVPTGRGAMDQNALNRKAGDIEISPPFEEMRV